ncbi:MAG: NADH-quinone oxidoreductase subunit N, partial [Planctomycetes bacterium]|nr:NADH-quinone oxidoreductase subunit N [Planctomycetota bacterium]
MLFALARQEAAAGVVNENVRSRFPEMVTDITKDVGSFMPELILCVGVMVVILADLFIRKERSRFMGFVTLGFVGLALIATISRGFSQEGSLFRGMVFDDGFGAFFKVLILVGTAICIPMVMMTKAFDGKRMGEFYGLLLGSVVGMFLMVTAKNLLMFFLGIEFASYTSYLLTAYLKTDRRASEGGLKYVVYGSVASGAMAYGLSLIYGLTGSLDIADLARGLVVEGTTDLTLVIAGLLCFAGFGYKMSAFPMHFWTPDVYEGAPIPFTAFLSVISKAAGFAIFIRFTMAFAGGGTWEVPLLNGGSVATGWPLLVGLIAAATMTIGNFSALFQTNLKRLLAYSSIAHAGYLLMGVAALVPSQGQGAPGWQGVLFYLVVYLFMNLGAFLVVAIIAERTGRETLEGYRGLGARSGLLSVALLVFLVSLIGLPPTAGFPGKVQLIRAVLENGQVWLAVVAVINTVVSVYYYARIIKLMFLDAAEEPGRVVISQPVRAFVLAMVIPVLWLGLFYASTVSF